MRAPIKSTGRTATGNIVRKITPAPGVAAPRQKAAAAGKDRGPEYWPRPTPTAKLASLGVLDRLASIGSDDISRHLSTMNLPNRAPAPLPIRKLNPAEIERAGWEHVRARGKLTGPAERPADWPQGQPWYPGFDLNPALARAIVAAEKAAAAAAR